MAAQDMTADDSTQRAGRRRGAAPAFSFPRSLLSAPRNGHSDKRAPSGRARTRQSPADAALESSDSLDYNGWTIIPRTFEIRGSRLWTLDLLIAHRAKQRAFTGPKKFRSEREAIRGCHAFGRRIIDGREPYCSVEDMR